MLRTFPDAPPGTSKLPDNREDSVHDKNHAGRDSPGRSSRPKVKRTDAIQAFVTQETPIVRIFTDDGARGTGYTYTIGTGGSSIVALLRDHMAPWLIGRDAAVVEELWKDLFFSTHATSVGAITASRSPRSTRRCGTCAAVAPACRSADGRRRAAPHPDLLDRGRLAARRHESLVDDALAVKAKGFRRDQDQGRPAARVRGRGAAPLRCATRSAPASRS